MQKMEQDGKDGGVGGGGKETSREETRTLKLQMEKDVWLCLGCRWVVGSRGQGEICLACKEGWGKINGGLVSASVFTGPLIFTTSFNPYSSVG